MPKTTKRGEEHGLRHLKEYKIWKNMRQRCLNPNNKRYCYYGDRGITICKQWDSFSTFLSDMGPKPTKHHTLDRTDNNGNYEPSNCHWTTMTEQTRNRRITIRIEYDGFNLTLAEWSDKTGIAYGTLKYRLQHKWPTEKIFNMAPYFGNRI